MRKKSGIILNVELEIELSKCGRPYLAHDSTDNTL